MTIQPAIGVVVDGANYRHYAVVSLYEGRDPEPICGSRYYIEPEPDPAVFCTPCPACILKLDEIVGWE